MASTSENTRTVVTLRSSDGDVFEVEKSVALQMNTVKSMIDNCCAEGGTIPLPDVTGPVLAKVIKYCRKHSEFDRPGLSKDGKSELKAWDREFIRVGHEELFRIVVAAHELGHWDLFDLSCRGVMDLIERMGREEFRALFNEKNDMTQEE